MTISIRPEAPGDEAAIHALTTRAFDGHPYSDGDEADVIDRLRDDGDLLFSLVAVDGEVIVGQATYSLAKLSNGDAGWAVLGPIAVEPSRHGEGIGRALIVRGEETMKAHGLSGITVLGDPEFYGRFGFQLGTSLRLEGELAEFLQVKSFGDPIPAATLSYAPAFD